MNPAFWSALRSLAAGKITVDRPRGSRHPRFPHVVYPLDYGYVEDTSSMDGGGIDVWRGSGEGLTGIVVTVDLMKRDSEIKILIGCTPEEVMTVLEFHNDSDCMKGIFIPAE